VTEPGIELVDQLFGGIGNHRARRKDSRSSSRIKRVIILRRHDAAHNDGNIATAFLVQRLDTAARGLAACALMGRSHLRRGAGPGVGQRDRVVAGLIQQSRNEGSDLACAQDQYAMHGDSSFPMWQSA